MKTFSLQKKAVAGFTLIEMLVSLALFTIVITITMGAFLSLIGNSEQLQSEQSVMTTLSFALDSMTRDIRTGLEYICTDSASTTDYSATAGIDCSPTAGMSGISYRESGGSVSGLSGRRIAYFYDATAKTILRKVAAGPAERIVSNGITITDARFFVTGTTKLGNPATDVVQPTVTIVIAASETGAGNDKPFILETTVTQRSLDL